MSRFCKFFTIRSFCSSVVTSAENVVRTALANRFPQALICDDQLYSFNSNCYLRTKNLPSFGFIENADIKVTDVSGGCGAMFEVFVQSNEFSGLNTLKQHKLVTNALKEHIKEMHGVRIHTAVPSLK